MPNSQRLMDAAQCYAVVRELRWPDGVLGPGCGSGQVNKRGIHDHPAHGQRSSGPGGQRQFEDRSGTLVEGQRPPLKRWVLGGYLMGLNLSNRQLAAELDLNAEEGQGMARQVREGVVAKKSQCCSVGKSKATRGRGSLDTKDLLRVVRSQGD